MLGLIVDTDNEVTQHSRPKYRLLEGPVEVTDPKLSIWTESDYNQKHSAISITYTYTLCVSIHSINQSKRKNVRSSSIFERAAQEFRPPSSRTPRRSLQVHILTSLSVSIYLYPFLFYYYCFYDILLIHTHTQLFLYVCYDLWIDEL